ncbi:uncharacterized protein LOC143279391 [Babylonia areolata]|uniref:uncharacterized protein LOC143279391 n=1 Tax=Babylonia areolata TaxID=304850 RepID=UPI003FD1CD49
MADTQQVLAAFLPHWRTCVGVKAFGAALGLFLTQLLLLVVSHVICSHWTLLRYTWKVLRRHQLPHRLRDFSRDAYLVYADTNRDVMWACRTLPELLRQHRHLRLLLKDVEELPTMCMAENIAQYIDMSWKIVLLVTQDFSRDEWACGFTVQQATRCITAMTPERVIVVFLENPDTLEPMPSLQLLLPLVPHHHIFHVHPMAPAHHPAWRALAEAIVGEERA